MPVEYADPVSTKKVITCAKYAVIYANQVSVHATTYLMHEDNSLIMAFLF